MRFITVAFLVAAAAIPILSQEVAKPAPSVPAASKVAPVISTTKLWRLVAKTQNLRQQIDASELGKGLKAAEAELNAEQAKLAGLCGEGFELGLQKDEKAENAGDVICVPKPPAEPKK
jgi:hypothetical protein